jgi:hypothetical protein
MFNPSEWKHTQRTINNSRVYINKQTGLPKLRNSFSTEQQWELDEYYAAQHEVKIYRSRDENN